MKKGPKPGSHFAGLTPDAVSLAAEVPFEGFPGWERVLTFPAQPPYRLNLDFLERLGRLGEALAAGIFSTVRDKRRGTIKWMREEAHLLTRYFEACIANGELPMTPEPKDLTSTILAGYAQWLVDGKHGGKRYNHCAAHTSHLTNMRIVRAAKESFGVSSEFRHDLVFATNPLGYSQSLHSLGESPQPLLSDADYRAIRKAVASDVLAIVNDTNRPAFPSSAESLLPFWLLLLIDTCGNPSSVSQLCRDCIRPHHFDPKQSVVMFQKPRRGSGPKEEYPFMIRDASSPLATCNIIRFLLAWTEPLVREAPSYLRNKLFLYRLCGKKLGELDAIGNNLSVGLFTEQVARKGFRVAYCSGKQLANFQAIELREKGLQVDWMRNRSVWRVKIRANHKSVTTTLRYLRSSSIMEARQEEMSIGLAAMRDAYIEKGEPVVQELPMAEAVRADASIPVATKEKMLAGTFNTGLSECSDPYNSPQPNQKPGQLCSAFWACTRCKCAHFYIEHLPLLLAQRRTLREADDDVTKVMWQKQFGPILRDIESVIAQFSEAAIRKAEKRVTDAHLTACRVDIISRHKLPAPSA